jgi:hypothetical protein
MLNTIGSRVSKNAYDRGSDGKLIQKFNGTKPNWGRTVFARRLNFPLSGQPKTTCENKKPLDLPTNKNYQHG